MKTLTIEDIQKAMDAIKTPEWLKGPECHIYMNIESYNLLYKSFPDNPVLKYERRLSRIKVFVDNEVPANQFFYCPHRVMELYKQLKHHRFMDPKVDCFKTAAGLYEMETKGRHDEFNDRTIDTRKYF